MAASKFSRLRNCPDLTWISCRKANRVHAESDRENVEVVVVVPERADQQQGCVGRADQAREEVKVQPGSGSNSGSGQEPEVQMWEEEQGAELQREQVGEIQDVQEVVGVRHVAPPVDVLEAEEKCGRWDD